MKNRHKKIVDFFIMSVFWGFSQKKPSQGKMSVFPGISRKKPAQSLCRFFGGFSGKNRHKSTNHWHIHKRALRYKNYRDIYSRAVRERSEQALQMSDPGQGWKPCSIQASSLAGSNRRFAETPYGMGARSRAEPLPALAGTSSVGPSADRREAGPKEDAVRQTMLKKERRKNDSRGSV